MSHTHVANIMAMNIWLKLTKSRDRLNNSCTGGQSESQGTFHCWLLPRVKLRVEPQNRKEV